MDGIDERMIHRAFDVARRAREHGNRPFGALLVDPDGNVLFEGENTVADDGDVTGHAETHVVRQATRALDPDTLSHCTMYASTEPCPMCSAAIFMSNIRRVVFGISAERLRAERGDPDAPALRLSCAEVLSHASHPIEVVGPFLEDEALAVHQD
ncbi:MAG TPA: nucleoside deaminase [Thermomicrobiales bacterium]|nr:nucleoside deaminase [Thermomicrobiales bacterium]